MVAQEKKEDGSNLFLQDKPKNILIYLKKENKPIYTAIIAKEIDSTYSHAFNVLSRLEKLKLVSFRKSGRVKLVKLTELGEEMGKVLINMIGLIKLAEMERELSKIYDREIKGKLREQMNKDSISAQINKLKAKINEFEREAYYNVSVFAKKLIKKTDDTLAEALGFPTG